MRFSRLLLPRKFKIIGLLLTLLALVMAVDRFYFDHKYSFLKWKVFSFYSEYLFPRHFVFTRNNQGDELVVLLSLVGLVLLILSKEKFECVEVNKLRVCMQSFPPGFVAVNPANINNVFGYQRAY